MSHLKLTFGMSPENWRIFSGRRVDPRFKPLETKVFERDYYMCQFCGFQAHEHQEVVNIDGDYTNNRPDNLATACVFCTQCQFLDVVGSLFGGGKLIYMPDISQAELNSFCHVIFCAMMNRTSYLSSAQSIYRNLRLQSQHVEKSFGHGGSSPTSFCRLLLNQKTFNEEKIPSIFKEIRLLPSYAKFKTELSDWARAAAEELAEEA